MVVAFSLFSERLGLFKFGISGVRKIRGSLFHGSEGVFLGGVGLRGRLAGVVGLHNEWIGAGERDEPFFLGGGLRGWFFSAGPRRAACLRVRRRGILG
jgi:hypothetical protein